MWMMAVPQTILAKNVFRKKSGRLLRIQYVDIFLVFPNISQNWGADFQKKRFPKIPNHLPSGKLLRNYGKSPCYSWENPLCRLGHFQVRELWLFTRG